MFFKNCPLCSSEQIVKFMTTFDRHYGYFDKLYDLYKCQRCGLLFLNPMVGDDELKSMYDEDTYYSYQEFKRKSKFSTVKKIIKFMLLGNFHIREKGSNGGKFLDLGCGSGSVLYRMKEKGWDVAGVEISQLAAKRGNEYGLNIFNGTLLEAHFEPETFDYIRSNHSFEHLTNPIETLREIHRILKPDGKLFIGVPNTRSLPFLMFRKYWYYLGVPFHPYNYNDKNLSEILGKNNFKIMRVKYVGNWRGLLGSIQIFLNRHARKVSSEGKFTNFLTKILFHQFARLLNMFHMGDCIEIIAQKRNSN